MDHISSVNLDPLLRVSESRVAMAFRDNVSLSK